MKAPKPFTWSGFSGGPRSCPGRQLAELEIKMITVLILKNYNLKCIQDKISMIYSGSIYYPAEKTIIFSKIADS